jgi:hypothetical protein
MIPRNNRHAQASGQPSGKSGSPLISNQKLVTLYRAVLRCQMLARRIRAEGLSAGWRTREREAVAAGVAIDLKAADRILAVEGCGLLPAFVRDGSAHAVFACLRKRCKTAPAQPRAGVLLAGALETARQLKREKTKSVAVLFCGAAVAPAFTLSIAAAERLPILFVCRNEGKKRNLAAAADGSGLPGITVDCEDAVAIYRVASEALAHARRGDGPTLIECRRWLIAEGERSQRGNKAVRNMERYLAGKGLFTRKLEEETAAACARELDDAAAAARGNAH